MRRYVERAGFLVLVYAIVLHALWGLLLIVSPSLLLTTPMAYLLRAMPQDIAGLVLVGVALGGLWGLKHPGWKGLVAATPQNFMLFVAATSGVASAVMGHYPDGVVRPALFILTDQLPTILVAALHAACLAVYHGREDRWLTSLPS